MTRIVFHLLGEAFTKAVIPNVLQRNLEISTRQPTMLLRLSTRTRNPMKCIFRIATLLSLLGTVVGQGVLSRPVSHFSAEGVTPTVALVRLAIQTHVPVGIEEIDKNFARGTVTVSIDNGTLNDALLAILGKFQGYEWKEEDGVVLVTKTERKAKKNLFDVVLPEYRLRRRASLPEAANLLWMTLSLKLNPAIRGFAGSFAAPEFPHQIEPCDLRNMTVRSILNLLVRSGGSPGWIATVPVSQLDTLPSRGLWTILPADEAIAECIIQRTLDNMSFEGD